MELIHFKDFQNINEFDDYTKYQQNLPTIGFIDDDVYYKKSTLNPEKQYFQILGLSDGTLYWKNSGGTSVKTISYSKDNGETWTDVTSTTEGAEIEINKNEIILFKGNNDSYNINTFLSNCQIVVQGNIMSLIYGDDFEDKTTLTTDYTFDGLFSGCTNLISAKYLILPATTLAGFCYTYMFMGCTSLISAPELPATTVLYNCYYGMFQGCSSLTSAPALPATTLTSGLTNGCYASMFRDCTSLVEAPELPATTLASSCYNFMFKGCSSLTTAPAILPATVLEKQCYRAMFAGCSSLTTAPELPAETLAEDCYIRMFSGCTSLVEAPELPAPILVKGCYDEMFASCHLLNHIECYATDISASACTYRWVLGVASAGTFVKKGSTWTRGVSGIPNGWEVIDNYDYLKFIVTSGGNITWKATDVSLAKTISYSKDFGETWTEITANTGSSAPTISVNSGDIVLFKGNNQSYSTGFNSGCTFDGSTCQFKLEGNIMSLIYGDDFRDKTTLESAYTFNRLFSNCTGLTSSENLVLPATTLTEGCYCAMFNGCSSLTNAPTLPATTLADNCYYEMFYGCSSLVIAPELPASALTNSCYYGMFQNCESLTTAPVLSATTLADYCYSRMFAGCTSLPTAPVLSATTLTEGCYREMFSGCTSLTTAPVLPATTLTNNCYNRMFVGCTSLTTAPELPATTLASNCYAGMFQGCTGLTTAPLVLPAETLVNGCYQGMFSGCISLTTAPELPATTLENGCYYFMFNNCSSLNYIKCLATDISATSCTNNWVKNVASTGTFVKNSSMTSWTTGANGIPTDWTVQNDGGTKNYLKFKIKTNGNIAWNGSNSSVIEYSKDSGVTWTSITASTATTIPVVAGDVVLFKGVNDTYSGDTFNGTTCWFSVEGNIMSLIYGNDFEDKTVLVSGYTFNQLFRECSTLLYTENLELPATTLTDSCYEKMFSGCTSLVTAPSILPATTLADSCYYGMFLNCRSLVTAPELPATVLVNKCYRAMFARCNSLLKAPSILPAKTLSDYCYYYMFYGCTSLTTAPELPATTLANNCYSYMFWECTSLTTAPVLPAATLTDYCYYEMFRGCTSLNHIECLATDISASACTFNWVMNVASTGTFVKNAFMTSWTTGANGIPSGWTVQDNIDYLKFKVTGNGNIKWNISGSTSGKVIQYSKNGSSWTSITASTATTISVNSGDTVLFKGNNDSYQGSTFSGTTCQFNVEGNVMSLIYGDNFKNKRTFPSNSSNNFYGLFKNCTTLISAKNIILPATTLTEGGYRDMFMGCSSLNEAPVLPATTLAKNSYNAMFQDCTSLLTAPELPATTLGPYCYCNMFNACGSLINGPSILPATTLTEWCYSYMLNNCPNLSKAPILPAITLVERCYCGMFFGCSSLNYIKCLAIDISASRCTYNWVGNVASTGTFVKNASMTSWTTSADGIPTGWTVQNA